MSYNNSNFILLIFTFWRITKGVKKIIFKKNMSFFKLTEEV